MMVPMRALFIGMLACAWASEAAAQPRWGTPDRPAMRQAAPAQESRPFAAPLQRSPQAERCANFRRELREARRAEREAGTTTGSNQASLRRQEIERARQEAGC